MRAIDKYDYNCLNYIKLILITLVQVSVFRSVVSIHPKYHDSLIDTDGRRECVHEIDMIQDSVY